MRIGLLQINTTVGDIDGNVAAILAGYQRAVEAGAEVVLTPELAITGYPPRDLLYKEAFVPRNLRALESLAARVGVAPLVVGYVEPNPAPQGNPFLNAAAVLHEGKIVAKRFKSRLPTYDVFDEDRYFEPCSPEQIAPVKVAGWTLGITICEDIWMDEYLPRKLYETDPLALLAWEGVDVALNLSASPWVRDKESIRAGMLAEQAAKHRVPIVYCNSVGGNDDLVFDGHSMAFDAQGGLLTVCGGFVEETAIVDMEKPAITGWDGENGEENLFKALVLGLKDYVRKCGFKSVVLGLSGGIDSALVATIAAHALGPESVLGVSMPSPYSSPGSRTDAAELARNLGIHYQEIPIGEVFEKFKLGMSPAFAGAPEDITEENMQARLRGLVLMSLSNKFGHLLLTTGNKSELAVGYCTLYGDMCGGLAVISDLPKTDVYRLSRWINLREGGEVEKGYPIPYGTIVKPPSAELRPDQKDQDSLPEYDVLDAILKAHVEEHLSQAAIVARGFDPATVADVCGKVDRNEYKRKQAAPGLKVTTLAFGTGRRMPIAQRFRE
ncbi:NAD+ synthase [Oscillatoria amoena NRMC-F 0135]|nr:NAD+ synthase [Oscillatoria laete-virens]MDL5046541.1 NAD+ synthase [Oscillatoria amoena NRMC-F 0135]MDL5054843.1 NAD+ synthase [Oscillatoria laete-virens NRMC-F 0139]